jgi:hypothetical protein
MLLILARIGFIYTLDEIGRINDHIMKKGKQFLVLIIALLMLPGVSIYSEYKSLDLLRGLYLK